MNKKILITGSNGLLGQSLLELLLQKFDYQVFGISKGKNRSGFSNFTYINLDITNKEKLLQTIECIKPDCIINTAAMTQVDDCETQKEACRILNIDVVDWLIESAKKHHFKIIHLSTDFIFDGKNGPYKETDIPNPLSYYGWSKLESENLLIQSNINFAIIRTILVFGKVHDMSRSNIVLWTIEKLKKQEQINIVDDQFRMPTFVKDLAWACKTIFENDKNGIFHISSNKLLSIYEIVQQIAETFNLDKSLINPIQSTTLNQAAKRPSITGFDLSKSCKELGFKSKSFKEDLQLFKQEISI
ncbi:MAG: SDR family oxidoreductase [Polaribacter sp.]|nr:SDR family oxidoreductase [Polaribacter sp.]